MTARDYSWGPLVRAPRSFVSGRCTRVGKIGLQRVQIADRHITRARNAMRRVVELGSGRHGGRPVRRIYADRAPPTPSSDASDASDASPPRRCATCAVRFRETCATGVVEQRFCRDCCRCENCDRGDRAAVASLAPTVAAPSPDRAATESRRPPRV
jgi:hypothetical protein